MKRIIVLVSVALGVGVGACSPSVRSTSYFEAHPAEADRMVAACIAASWHKPECDNAGLAKSNRERSERMKLYGKAL